LAQQCVRVRVARGDGDGFVVTDDDERRVAAPSDVSRQGFGHRAQRVVRRVLTGIGHHGDHDVELVVRLEPSCVRADVPSRKESRPARRCSTTSRFDRSTSAACCPCSWRYPAAALSIAGC
jgi:hypothetical protein